MNQTHLTSVSKGILQALRRCGHFLHYKTGGRAGRRRILFALLEGELLQRELQDLLGVQSGSLSEIIIKMEADGWIEKGKSQKDGRHLVLRLTPDGFAQAMLIKKTYEEQVYKMLSCFSEEQQLELYRMLKILDDHWTSLETDEAFSWTESEDIPPEKKGGS